MNDSKNKKEVIFYSIIVVILLSISILNNNVWKIGREQIIEEDKGMQQLEVNNITYNVPFEEQWLD